ncbi:MAG: phage major capsid protein [Candidatus Competibacteraceae bacterium]|nr:phage major capsid protein [Candidatus Competibacteraceae bacterium]
MVGRDIRSVKKLTTSEGNPLYMEDFSMGRKEMFVDGDPLLKFNLLPKNLGVGTNESVVYYGEWSMMEVVQSQSLEFFTFNETYMANLQIGVMAWTFVDYLVHYPEAFVRMTGVKAQ